MTRKLPILQVPLIPDGQLMHFLVQLRSLVLDLSARSGVNLPIGCGLMFDASDNLLVDTDAASIHCHDVGLSAVDFVGMVKGNRAHQARTLIATSVLD